jgi:hypothetical protein
VTHGNVTDDIRESSRRLDGKDKVTPMISMFVARDGVTVSRAGDATGFGEVHDAVDDEVMSTGRTCTNPSRTGELMMSVGVKDFGA